MYRAKNQPRRYDGRLRFDDDLGSFEVLRTALELGSLAAAARRLHLNPIGVRQRVRRLETRLGLRLLERTTRRRLEATTDGLSYLERYAPIVAQVMAARAALTGRLARGSAATAPPQSPAGSPAMSPQAVAALPAQLDITVRRLEGGQWAAVCFQRQQVRMGPDPAHLVAQLAADLTGNDPGP